MIDIKVEFHNFSYAKIICEPSVFFDMKDHFSFYADNYRFSPKFKCGIWDGKIHLLENNGLIPIGLVPHIPKFASNMDYTYHIDPNIVKGEDLSRDDFNTWLSSKPIQSGGKKIEPYWYQSDAVFNALTKARALLVLPTSAGKSLIQALLSRYYLEHYEGKVLIIVPTTSLTVQMKSDFLDYGLFKDEHILEIRAGTLKNSKARVYVSTWQSACKQSKEWFSQFGMMINDECHKSLGKTLSNVIKDLDNCIFKIGLTGTLKDGKANIMQYEGMFGQQFKPTTTERLMEEGQATKLKINVLILNYPDKLKQVIQNLDYAGEIAAVNGFKRRNDYVCNLSSKLAKSREENVFLMFKYKEHGKSIYDYMCSIHGEDKVFLISGDNSTKERDILKRALEDKKGTVVVASYGVFSTGVSIKNLHHVVFAHGVKDKITVLQTIGRILRNHESKSIATLWDIVDDAGIRSVEEPKKYKYKNYLLRHAIERIERYASERFDYSIRTVEL